MKAFIYLRVSTTTQEKDGAGLEVQQDVCTAFAREHGYTVERVFHDAYTGYEYRERPALSEMRGLVRQREVDAVIFYALDRLSRNQTHQAVLVDEAEHAGVRYLSATEDLDTSVQGQILRAVIGGMAELEREKIRARTQGGLRKRVEKGLMLAGRRPPYGYRWVEENGKKIGYAIIEDEAAVIRRIFNAVAGGVSCRQVAMALKNEGVPSPGGGMWVGTNLAKVVRNPIYKGDPAAYRYSGCVAATKARKRGLQVSWTQQEGIPIKGGAPAIVSEALWTTANAVADGNRERSVRSAREPEEALLRGGIAVCGYCGFALRHQRTRTKWDHRYQVHRHAPREYACSPQNRHRYDCPGAYIYGEVLDNAAWSFIVDLLGKPEVILKQLTSRKTEDPTEGDLAIVDRQIKEIDRKLANIRTTLPSLDDEDFRQSMIEQANQWSARRKGLLQEQDELERQRELWQRSQNEIDSVTKMLARVRGALREDLTYQQKRRFLTLLNVRVRCYRKGHDPRATIEWSIEPNMADEVALALEQPAQAPSFPLTVDTTSSSPIRNVGTGSLRFSFALTV